MGAAWVGTLALLPSAIEGAPRYACGEHGVFSLACFDEGEGLTRLAVSLQCIADLIGAQFGGSGGPERGDRLGDVERQPGRFGSGDWRGHAVSPSACSPWRVALSPSR